VALVPDGEAREGGEVFRRRDGRLMPASVERVRYSTPEQLALEQRFVDRVMTTRGVGAGVASDVDLERALATRPTLSDEQRRMIEVLCRDGDGVAVVAGKAGTGKTFALGAAREAWQAAGYPVLGVATARRAANELQTGAGIQSTSIVALRSDLLRGGGASLPRHCVLVVDEAGMVPTRELAELVDQIERVEGKVVLIGGYQRLVRAGRSVAWSSAGLRSSSPRTSARSIAGSARRSTTFGTGEPRKRSRSTPAMTDLSLSRRPMRSGSGWCATGCSSTTPTGA
jgi:ATP-dependent exoDNAse (exonuclease V) alpha subunit